MNLARDQLIITAMIIGIVVLAGAVFVLLQQKPSTNGSFAKNFALDVHTGLLEASQTTTELADAFEATTPPLGKEAEFEQLYALAVSNEEELQWLLDEETPVFEELQQTENNARALDLLQRETGFFLLATHLGSLQESLAEIATSPDVNTLEDIAFAQEIAPDLKAKAFVSPQNAQAIADKTGLTEQQVQQGARGVLNDFLEYKKERFEAAFLIESQAIEAQKILAWYFLLEGLPE